MDLPYRTRGPTTGRSTRACASVSLSTHVRSGTGFEKTSMHCPIVGLSTVAVRQRSLSVACRRLLLRPLCAGILVMSICTGRKESEVPPHARRAEKSTGTSIHRAATRSRYTHPCHRTAPCLRWVCPARSVCCQPNVFFFFRAMTGYSFALLRVPHSTALPSTRPSSPAGLGLLLAIISLLCVWSWALVAFSMSLPFRTERRRRDTLSYVTASWVLAKEHASTLKFA